jgi:hypothetical protein
LQDGSGARDKFFAVFDQGWLAFRDALGSNLAMAGSKRGVKVSEGEQPLLATCWIVKGAKFSHLAFCAEYTTPAGGSLEELVLYSKLLGANSLEDSAVSGILLEFDSVLVGILVATEMRLNVLSAAQTHRLQRIVGTSGESIWTKDIRGLRKPKQNTNLDWIVLSFTEGLFDKAKALNREWAGESFYSI